MPTGVRVEIQPTSVGYPEPAGTRIRYNVVVVNDTTRMVDVIARDQETVVPLPDSLQQRVAEVLVEVGGHMGRVVGLAEAPEGPVDDGTPLTKVPDEEEEL